MSATAKRYGPLALVGLASAWIAFRSPATGDYPVDAQPAVQALAHGHVSAFLEIHPLMGPLSLLVRAPFAALAGADPVAAYQAGSLACVLAAGMLGLYLAGLARRRGLGGLAQLAIVSVCLVNPMTFAALDNGHPEEILTAALAVGAVAVASEGHTRRAALLLGLALASKQWAVIAILPVLMALPSCRFKVALGAAAVALVLVLPGFIAAPHAFLDSQSHAAGSHRVIGRWTVWYPLAGSGSDTVTVGPGGQLTVHPFSGGSAFLGRWSHPLILMLGAAIPLALAGRRRRFGLPGSDAMALLALLALMRCALDPVDNLYYHAPLLLALVGWDALSLRGLPLRALIAVALATLLSQWAIPNYGPHLFNALYVAVVGAAGIAMILVLWRRPLRRAPSGVFAHGVLRHAAVSRF